MLHLDCLINQCGYLYMDWYDKLPDYVRKRIGSSSFNLCQVCLTRRCYKNAIARNRLNPTMSDWIVAIDSMESDIRSAFNLK